MSYVVMHSKMIFTQSNSSQAEKRESYCCLEIWRNGPWQEGCGCKFTHTVYLLAMLGYLKQTVSEISRSQ